MNTQDVIETVQNIFIGADNKDWDLCLAAFAGKVVLDYTSLNGGEPSCIDAEEIIETWRNFLPRFKSTHHQLGNFTIHAVGEHAEVYCYGTAFHYFPNSTGNNVWTVVGTYDISVQRLKDTWRVTALKFNFKFADGNLEIPNMIVDKKE